MKKALLLVAVLPAVGSAGPADYVNFVRQIQTDSGVEWDVSVAPTGSMVSLEGVGPEGSLFQLWSIHGGTGMEYHLDEEFVSAYTPVSSIEIETADPYEHIARTRVDQPFRVRVEVSGLLGTDEDLTLPLAARQVLLSHKVGEYPEGRHSFEAVTTTTGEVVDPYRVLATAVVDSNGSFTLEYGVTNLEGGDMTQVEGEEVWAVSALKDESESGLLLEGEVLEAATLQIWPIAQAVISGLDPATRYDNLPPVTVALRDLYPDSTTHVRVYLGSPDSVPAEKTDLQASYVIIQDSIPQNRVLTLSELDDYFPKTGSYTMEVIHRTPFGVEVLNRFYPINIDRKIMVRGAVFSTE